MGKEWQDELNLNVYALDYRQYDPALGRFSSPDVLAEKAYSITPYRYGFNNPVFWRDPLGLYEDDWMDYDMEYDNWGGFEGNQFGPGRGIQLADIVVMGWNRFERFDDDFFEQMQDRLDNIPFDKLDKIMNISLGASGSIITTFESWRQKERRIELAKGTKTGINKVDIVSTIYMNGHI